LFTRIKALQYNPIVVLARVDESIAKIRTQAMKPTEELEKQRQAASAAFSIPLARVFYAVPYRTERERVFDIERLAYRILDEAICAAKDYCDHLPSSSFDWGVGVPASATAAASGGASSASSHATRTPSSTPASSSAGSPSSSRPATGQQQQQQQSPSELPVLRRRDLQAEIRALASSD
jgi:hypothetical protein